MADFPIPVIRYRGKGRAESQTAQYPLGSSLVVSVDLVARGAETGNTVAVEVALPDEEFVDPTLVHAAGFFD